MQYLIHRAGFGFEAIADSKDELFSLLGGIEDATGYSVYQPLPALQTGQVVLTPCTQLAAFELYDRCDFCAVSDPDNPEASFPAFVREHVTGIREEFNEYLRERNAA